MADHLEMELFLRAIGGDGQVKGNKGRRGAEFARDGREMVARDRADGADDIHDFCGSEARRKRHQDVAAGHREAHAAEVEEQMPAQVDANGLDGRDDRDRSLREDAEPQRKGASKFSFEIDGAAAHARDDAGTLDLWSEKLNQDDGLFRAEEIRHDADNFEVEFLSLVAGKDGVRIAFHPGPDFTQRKNFRGLGGRGRAARGAENQGNGGDRLEKNPRKAGRALVRLSQKHEPKMILGGVPRINSTAGGPWISFRFADCSHLKARGLGKYERQW